MDNQLTVGSLFSGIGGLDLGLERAGMRVIWQSEIDPYASRVLKKHWPEVPNYGDIKNIEWGSVPRPDVICGGYPCQPFSTAGKRRGEEDPRHLWPWVRDAISELRPRYAILENVRGHLTMGGLSVIGELANIGYNAEWRIISAASVGANHRRDRIIIVAYPGSERLETTRAELETTGPPRSSKNAGQFVADPTGERVNVGENNEHSKTAGERKTVQEPSRGKRSPMAHPDGAPEQLKYKREVSKPNLTGRGEYRGWEWWQTEPDVGRVANGVPFGVDRLRGLGNAVVPQVAEVIGRLVIEHANNG